jgi:hypothetical protein
MLVGAAAASAASFLVRSAQAGLVDLSAQIEPDELIASARVSRFHHSATALRDGRILVTGGYLTQGDGIHRQVSPTNSSSIFEPFSGSWFPAAPMTTGRARHASTLLADGSVVVVGGINGFLLDSIEIYDPSNDRWTKGPSIPVPMADHTVCAAGNRIVLMGGPTGASVHVLELDRPSSFSA